MPNESTPKSLPDSDKNLSDYSSAVRDIIIDYHEAVLKPALDDDSLARTVASWMNHLIQAGIPLSRLWEVYSKTLLSGVKFLTVVTLIDTWKTIIQDEVKTPERFCSICSNTGQAVRMDMKTGQDETIPCICPYGKTTAR
jgi:hypothetical protein